MTVLVADDSDPVRARVAQIVSELGSVDEVYEAIDGLSAIEKIEQVHPDIVILDIKMPAGGGLAVLERFPPGSSRRPLFVALTNFPYPQLRQKCVQLGVDHFLDKYSDYDKVLAVLEAHASKEHP